MSLPTLEPLMLLYCSHGLRRLVHPKGPTLFPMPFPSPPPPASVCSSPRGLEFCGGAQLIPTSAVFHLCCCWCQRLLYLFPI